MPYNSTSRGRFVSVQTNYDQDYYMLEECMFCYEIGEPCYKAKEDDAIEVLNVDLNIAKNSKDHITDKFDLTTEKDFLIVRRGQSFQIDLEFSRVYDKSTDDICLVFKFGKTPKTGKGTYIDLILSDKDKPKKWGAKILPKDSFGKSLKIEVFTPPDCPVGKWKLDFVVIKKNDTMDVVHKFKQKKHMYILFNPWCKDDQVFMPQETLLNEYVLSQVGVIYRGTHSSISPKLWEFAQFKDVVLDCCLYLLDKGKESSNRGDPVMVARKISALVNSSDDSGVLTGNWSGDYEGGNSPLKWSGSHKILEEYYKTKTPVKYGQCWVFSGLVTTVCRALGIPARSVTNFASAHDTDQSVTIDYFVDEDGTRLDNSDSVWNFHVWNDVWMSRPNLTKDYRGSGWQALDSTPQEASDGIYRMGPMPLEAIKRGDITVPYDGSFVFAEVNADKEYWMKRKNKPRGHFHVRTVKNAVGKNISTKAPNSFKREDITNQYKFAEGSEEERTAVRKAEGKTAVHREEIHEVEFDVSYDINTFVGQNLELCVKITNKGTTERTVKGKLTLESMFYTGVPHKTIKKMKLRHTDIGPGAEMTKTFIVKVDAYIHKLTDHFNLKLTTLFFVPETDYHTTDDIEIRLRKPHLTIKANTQTTSKVRTPYTVEVSFENPLPMPLTDCELVVDGPVSNILPRPLRKIPKKGTMLETIEVYPTTAGENTIIVTFNSLELTGIDVSHDMCISN